jgi:hypothetical protein
LITFAATAHALLTRVPAGLALALASGAWLTVALSTYLTFEALRRRVGRPRLPAPGRRAVLR